MYLFKIAHILSFQQFPKRSVSKAMSSITGRCDRDHKFAHNRGICAQEDAQALVTQVMECLAGSQEPERENQKLM